LNGERIPDPVKVLETYDFGDSAKTDVLLHWLNLCLSDFLSDRLNSSYTILAELQREKRASKGPWVRKIGNPSS